MPLDFRKFKKEIENEGYHVIETRKGHYKILTKDGDVLECFSVSHGKRTKRGEVWDPYVNLVRNAIKANKDAANETRTGT